MNEPIINGMPLQAFLEMRDDADKHMRELMEIKAMLREAYEDNTCYVTLEREDVERILGIMKEETECTTA